MRAPAQAKRAAGAALLALLAPPALALAQGTVEPRTGFIECGQTQITARAECHAGSAYCLTETLTFSRTNARATVPLHRNYGVHEFAGAKVKVLDYHAAGWACVPGRTGGRYLVVALRRAAGGNCPECEYTRLYDLNGRLIAADFTFDGQGRATENKTGRDMMLEVLGKPAGRSLPRMYP